MPPAAELGDGQGGVVDGAEGVAGDEEHGQRQVAGQVGGGEAGGVGGEQSAGAFDEQGVARRGGGGGRRRRSEATVSGWGLAVVRRRRVRRGPVAVRADEVEWEVGPLGGVAQGEGVGRDDRGGSRSRPA